ncbi:MAG: heme exporter protein CcmB [Methylovirgula sp.]
MTGKETTSKEMAHKKGPSPLAALLLRELRIARRIGGAASMGVIFFLCLVTITPFAIGPELKLLARIGPAILWIAALLATLLGLDRLFQADHDDGSLDLFYLGETPLELIVLVKCFAHWLMTGLPLVAASPLFGLMLGLQPQALGEVALSLLVGTPALTLIGAIGAGLTVTLRRGGLLLSILVLPICVPVLIFGVAAASTMPNGPVSFATPFLILCGLTLGAIAVAPFAVALALRNATE